MYGIKTTQASNTVTYCHYQVFYPGPSYLYYAFIQLVVLVFSWHQHYHRHVCCTIVHWVPLPPCDAVMGRESLDNRQLLAPFGFMRPAIHGVCY